MKEESLQAEQQYLATLLEAIQRCVFFLNASVQKIPWPIRLGYEEKRRVFVHR